MKCSPAWILDDAQIEVRSCAVTEPAGWLSVGLASASLKFWSKRHNIYKSIYSVWRLVWSEGSIAINRQCHISGVEGVVATSGYISSPKAFHLPPSTPIYQEDFSLICCLASRCSLMLLRCQTNHIIYPVHLEIICTLSKKMCFLNFSLIKYSRLHELHECCCFS